MGVTFTKKSAGRIAESVRYTEAISKADGFGPGKKRLVRSPLGFWAKIGEKDGKRYAWKQLEAKPLNDPDVLGEAELLEGTTDKNQAYEINGSKWVLKDDVVWLTPALGQEFYVFEYCPGPRKAKVGSEDIDEAGDGEVVDAEVELYKFDSDSGQLAATGENVTVYNWTSGKIKKDRFISIGYSQADKIWFIEGEDCSKPSEDDEEE